MIVDPCWKVGNAGVVEVCVIGPPDGCVEELDSYVESLLGPCVCRW